jgi:biotin transport system substrate-specific component
MKPAIAQKAEIRAMGIFGMAIATGIAAQLSIPLQPVPVTLQVLAVLLAGLMLGPKDGYASQVVYLGLIALGLPLAADGVGGLVAFSRPSTGYLVVFPIAAYVVGWISSRWNADALACLAGVLLIYLAGTLYLKFFFDIYRTGASWENAFAWGVQPFIVADFAKALVAISAGEGLRMWWRRALNPLD